jgi:hypothetical protein
MGFFDEVLNAIGKVVNVVMYAAGTITGIALAGTVEFVQVACEKFGEYRTKNRTTNLALANKPVHSKTRELNDSISELERKKARDRSLNRNDHQRLIGLYEQRDRLKQEVWHNNELVMTERMVDGKGVYDNLHITDVNTHVLQFHVGQTVFGKRCRQCGRPMILQWKQGMATVTMSDFFWGCIGFYEGVRHNEPFHQTDMNLFTRIDRPEFEVSTNQLNTILQLPAPRQHVAKRLSEARQQEAEVYLCPIHNEPMVLREKKDAQGLLDQFFFGCPRWTHKDGGCNQIVKLKSPGQLASALEAYYGRGIM